MSAQACGSVAITPRLPLFWLFEMDFRGKVALRSLGQPIQFLKLEAI
jgi:hypothetical protein